MMKTQGELEMIKRHTVTFLSQLLILDSHISGFVSQSYSCFFFYVTRQNLCKQILLLTRHVQYLYLH